MKYLKIGCISALLALGNPMPVIAQSGATLFDTVVQVNDDVVTNFELIQRTRMLELFGATGNRRETALDQLINERIFLQAGRAQNIVPTEEDVFAGMEEFISRGNLNLDEFLALLAQQGIDQESFRDFIAAGVVWREVVRSRFVRQVTISDDEVAIALNRAANLGNPLVANSAEITTYATLTLPNTADAGARARVLRTEIDNCFDLRANQDKGVFEEISAKNAEIPASIASELVNLDTDETTSITLQSGRVAVLMLCDRTRELPEGSDEEIRAQLFSNKVAGLGAGLLQELRGDAFIDFK
ncbi:MAG: SurA N-terminal domain-containing protein [Pseudomonadota bacterium]